MKFSASYPTVACSARFWASVRTEECDAVRLYMDQLSDPGEGSGDSKDEIAFMLRIIMECDSALRNCFLSHYHSVIGTPWVDSAENGEMLWLHEEEEIQKLPKKSQWRPMGFTISLIKSGDSKKWDITAFGYVLGKSMTISLPADCEDRKDLEILVNIRNRCAHVKKHEEMEVAKLQQFCVDTALRVVSRHDFDKVCNIQSLLDQRRHKNWIREQDLNVGDRIGSGGQSEVFRGKLRVRGRCIDVAIKVPRPAEESINFLKELKAVTLASLRCNRSCRIYGVSRKDGKLCLVMKLYERSLADVLAAGKRDGIPALSLMIQIFQALAELHEANIVSLDVKPSNLLLDKYNNLVVADFGISYVMDNTATACNLTGNAQGTYRYMAPECFESGKAVGYKSDVWGAACCGLHILSGQPPFSEIQVVYEIDCSAEHMHSA